MQRHFEKPVGHSGAAEQLGELHGDIRVHVANVGRLPVRAYSFCVFLHLAREPVLTNYYHPWYISLVLS